MMNQEHEKYADCLGVLEIRTYVDQDYDEFWEEPIDMYLYQEKCHRRNRGLGFDEYFCKKDYDTTVQKHFFCLVCDCEIKHVATLDAHVKGNKHIRKALQKKRQELGIPQEPPHQPQTKTQKKEPPRPRPQLMKIPLTDRLREESAMGIPALGLSYVHEWINPKSTDEPRRYTCVLEGCKSAWGDSEDMYRHLVGKSMLHNKNYLIYHLNQDHVKHYKKDELTEACVQCDKKERGYHLEKDRDYAQIQRHMDYDMYKELVNRPMDWSEKKEKHGIAPKKDVGKNAGKGANLEPLGKRKSFGGQDNANLAPLGERPRRSDDVSELNQPAVEGNDAESENVIPFHKFDKVCERIETCIENSSGTTTKTLVRAGRAMKCLSSLLKEKQLTKKFRPEFEKNRLNIDKIQATIQGKQSRITNHVNSTSVTIKKEKDGIGLSQKVPHRSIQASGDNGFVHRGEQPIKREYHHMADINQNQVSAPNNGVLQTFYDEIQLEVLKTLKRYLDAGIIERNHINPWIKTISKNIYDGEVSNRAKQGFSTDDLAFTMSMRESMQKYISKIDFSKSRY